jgi:hypothetical protein
VRTDDGHQFFLFKQSFDWFEAEDNADVSGFIFYVVLRRSVVRIVEWVSPQDVSEQTVLWWLSEPVHLVDGVQIDHTRRNAAVQAEQFTVHNRSDRQTAEE